jgi:hypothetical protein
MSTAKTPKKISATPQKPAKPATAADPTQAFLREVDDALQQEKLEYVWQTYRLPLMGGVAALVLAVAGWQLWQNSKVSHTAEVANDWYTYQKMSVDNSDAKTALRQSIEKEGTNGYKALAIFAEAETAPDAKTAEAAYARVYTDNAQPLWLRENARLSAAMRLMGTDNAAAQAHFEKLVTYADPREASAAAAVALEQLAVIAISKGDAVSARGYTEKLMQIPYLTADLRQRAEKRLGAL